MPRLIKYGVLPSGCLTKAQCYICGAKYGSIEEAKKCEERCLQEIIGMNLTKDIFPKGLRNK